MKNILPIIWEKAGAKRMAATLSVMAVAACSATYAQTWTGEALPEESGDYYLYNRGGDGFLLGGNSWGTQASLGEPGLLCTLSLSEGKYSIRTGCSSDPAKVYLGSGGYIDQPVAEFELESVSGDEQNVFTIKSGDNYLKLSSGTLLEFKGTDAGDAAAQWLLVSRKQRIGALKSADKDNGVDASFYIVRPNFSRGEQETPWVESHEGGSVSLYGPDQGASSSNYCAEARDNTNFNIYQQLTGLPNGRYKVSCQGFYRAGAAGTSNQGFSAVLYANEVETPLQSLTGSDAPTDYKGAASAFRGGTRYADNSVDVVVTDGTLKIGIKKYEHIESDWIAFDSFRLTYYGETDEKELFDEVFGLLSEVRTDFEKLGATSIVRELDELYATYEQTTDYAEAYTTLSAALNSVDVIRGSVSALCASLETADNFLKEIDGTSLSEEGMQKLTATIETGREVLTSIVMDDAREKAGAATTEISNIMNVSRIFMALSYNLKTVKSLADEIGGMENEEAYKKVVSDLVAAELTYDGVKEDVDALRALCRERMTAGFLAQASEDNPIDMTCFIANPNIFQNGEATEMPDGWTMVDRGSLDNKNMTLDAHSDTQLQGYSWSGNASNNLAFVHYRQQVGGSEEGGVDLPDGLYELSAATFVSAGGNNIMLYASVDNEDLVTEWFNRTRSVYDEACENGETTTTVKNIVVRDGTLYLGVKGVGLITVTGAQWLADNFRLSYVGALPEEVGVTMKAEFGTMILPFAADIPEGLKVFSVPGATPNGKYNTLSLEEATSIAANVPYVIQRESEAYTTFTFTGVPCNDKDSYTHGLLTGVLTDTYAPAGSYVLQNQEGGLGFYPVADDNVIKVTPNHVYLTCNATAEVRVFLFDLPDGTTSVAEVETRQAQVDVYSINGVLIRKGVKAGEALDGLAKGLYIVNGVKKAVK